MTKRIVAVLLSLLLLLPAFGAMAEGTAVTFTDMMGREITLAEPATRIVALTAADCEILCALGCEDALVGRGEYCDYPASVLEKPSVQSGYNTNIEEIIALQPQVVLMGTMAQTTEQVEALAQAGIQVVVSDAQNIEGVYTAIRLIGAIIVGTGIPQIGEERELLKNYYDRKNGSGFDYAYRIPGMNKVLQSAGRVIRTARDRGVILLLDSRFDMQENRKLFPADWREDVRLCSLSNVKDSLQGFWQADKEKQNESDESGAYQQGICLPSDSDGRHGGN